MSRKLIIALGALAAIGIAAYAPQASAHDEPVAGSLIGAGIGAAFGGPPGAAVGAIIGSAIGATIAHEADHNKHVRRVHHSRAHIQAPRREPVGYDDSRVHIETPRRERVVYVEPPPALRYTERARYVPAYNGNGSTAHCDPERTKPKAVKASTKPKVKKVCRYVAVR